MFYLVLLIVCAVILSLYVRFAYKLPSKVMILQSSLKDFQFNLLLEKQPIVVQDRVEDIKPIWDSWFKYNIKSEFMITPDMEWIKNKYKYMLLHSLEDCEVLLCAPTCKIADGIPDTSEQVIAIRLYKHMSMVIPYRWYFHTDKSVHARGCHDLLTYFLPG